MTLVRCNQTLRSGKPCNILYPHKDAKHSGPCIYCCRQMIRTGHIERLRRELKNSKNS